MISHLAYYDYNFPSDINPLLERARDLGIGLVRYEELPNGSAGFRKMIINPTANESVNPEFLRKVSTLVQFSPDTQFYLFVTLITKEETERILKDKKNVRFFGVPCKGGGSPADGLEDIFDE